MRIVLAPVGSAGDVHPFVGVALALRARGHDVTIITSAYFAPLMERVGLPFVPIGTVEQFNKLTEHPDLWNQWRGLQVIARAVELGTLELYQAVSREVASGDAVLVASGLAMGARIAHEVLEVPLVTLHLQPQCFFSIHDSPVMHPWLTSINRFPRSIKRILLALSDRVADRVMAPAANNLRQELGLSPVRHIVSQWWHSPQRVIGLFPDWFAPPQLDWPAQTVLTGFPLYDERDVTDLTPGLETFYRGAEDAGKPPIIFAPGSGNRQAGRFLAAAADACHQLGRRGILLTRYPAQLPSRLPDEVRHFDYVPLSVALPRAAALVHHGGIGTAAQGLASGRPQLVMPMTFDQPDNANRLGLLGVARVLRPAAFTARAVTRELEILLGSDDVTRACAKIARRFEDADPITHTCELIENMESNRRETDHSPSTLNPNL